MFVYFFYIFFIDDFPIRIFVLGVAFVMFFLPGGVGSVFFLGLGAGQ